MSHCCWWLPGPQGWKTAGMAGDYIHNIKCIIDMVKSILLAIFK